MGHATLNCTTPLSYREPLPSEKFMFKIISAACMPSPNNPDHNITTRTVNAPVNPITTVDGATQQVYFRRPGAGGEGVTMSTNIFTSKTWANPIKVFKEIMETKIAAGLDPFIEWSDLGTNPDDRESMSCRLAYEWLVQLMGGVGYAENIAGKEVHSSVSARMQNTNSVCELPEVYNAPDMDAPIIDELLEFRADSICRILHSMVGHTFYGIVTLDKNGYHTISRIELPGLTSDAMAAGLNSAQVNDPAAMLALARAQADEEDKKEMDRLAEQLD